MTKNEITAHNAGIAAVVALAQASADAVRAKLVEKPTRFAFAVAALEGLAEAATDLMLPLPPEGPEAASVAFPRPLAPNGPVAA